MIKLFFAFVESTAQNDVIYYGSNAIQRSPSQQVILVNSIRNDEKQDGKGNDVDITWNQNDILSRFKNEACDNSKIDQNDIVKNSPDDIGMVAGDYAGYGLKEEDMNDHKTGDDLNQMTEINDKKQAITPTAAKTTTGTQNENILNTSIPMVATTISKIPILQYNLRQAKCASWAGGELNAQQIHSHLTRNSSKGRQTFSTNAADIAHINDALPTSLISASVNKQNVPDNSDCIVFQSPDIKDLTPGLLSFSFTVELSTKY